MNKGKPSGKYAETKAALDAKAITNAVPGRKK